jgi:undecaprenyl-diphosphatase
MQDFLLKIDYWLFDVINQQSAFDLGDIFFPWVTDLHLHFYFKVIAFPLVIFFFLKTYKKMGLPVFILLLIAIGVNDFTGSVVKNQVLRLRPFENKEIVATRLSPAGSKSFYSNHASNMFTFATYTGQMIPALQVPLYVIATTVGYSRVYNGVHYPSDVAAGSAAGFLWGYLFSQLAKKLLAFVQNRKKEKV